GGARALQRAHEARDAAARSRASRSLAEAGRAAVGHDPHDAAPQPRTGRRGDGHGRVVSRARAVVEAIAKALAERPESVSVTEREARGQTLVELTMAPGDMGRVIGRQGRTAQAVRTLANLAAEMDGQKVSVDFRD